MMTQERIAELRASAHKSTILGNPVALTILECVSKIESLQSRVQDLEKDKARLEWYFKHGRNANLRQNENDLWIVDGNPGWSTSNWRAAIDAAMKGTNEH